MIKYSLAGYYSHYRVNMMILLFYRFHPEFFYDNIQIDSVFGCLPAEPWSGCRIITPKTWCNPVTRDIYDLRDSYYDMGVKLRHTYTNSQLTEDVFHNFRSLQWTEACHKEGNSIILVDERLKKFLHERFPLYNFVWSTSLCCKDLNKINELSKEDMVVLDYNFNTDTEALKSLENPKNIEIMLSEACPDNCPYRYKHYQVESRHILNAEKDKDEILTCYLTHVKYNTFYDMLRRNNAILTLEQVNDLHDKYGFENFKIAGRDYNPITYTESLMYYLVKPEHKDYVRQMMLLEYFEWLERK